MTAKKPTAKKPTKAEMIAASMADTKRRVRRSNKQMQLAEFEKAVARAAMEYYDARPHGFHVRLLDACAAARKGGVR